VLKELGLRVPKGVKIKVLQNTARMMYVVLPAKPKGKRHHVAPVGPEDDI